MHTMAMLQISLRVIGSRFDANMKFACGRNGNYIILRSRISTNQNPTMALIDGELRQVPPVHINAVYGLGQLLRRLLGLELLLPALAVLLGRLEVTRSRRFIMVVGGSL